MIRERLTGTVGNYSLYHVKENLPSAGKIPFRISSEPLYLPKNQLAEVAHIGKDLSQFIGLVEELYQQEGAVRTLLNRGKPEIFCVDKPFQYLFIRPDLIITNEGFAVCEIETSPFGLALAHLLAQGYQEEGFTTVVSANELSAYIQQQTAKKGAIIYTNHTQAFSGQLAYLADRVFSEEKDRHWQVRKSGEYKGDPPAIYRGFYLVEALTDPTVKKLVDSYPKVSILPSLTPQLEEKAILSLLWDKRWESYLTRQLGLAVFNHLKHVVPPTWVVGQEKFFSGTFPKGIESALDLVKLSRSQRAFVLKPSGFCEEGSWARGVEFLSKLSAQNAGRQIDHALREIDNLWVLQQFIPGRKIEMYYINDDGNRERMMGKVRLTPYFSLPDGKLIAIKATCCADTDYIHATSASINTAVSEGNSND